MHLSIRKSLLLAALIVLGFIGSICADSSVRLTTKFTNNDQDDLVIEPQAHQAYSTDVSAERMDRISAAAQRGLFSIPEGRDFTVAADVPYEPDELLVYFAPKGDGEVRSGAEKSQILSSISGSIIKRNFKTVPGLNVVTLPA